MLDKYKLVGKAYDTLSKLYSGGAINRCKTSMLRSDTINPESKVLFAGAGAGQDAILAAELGAHVTLIDISPTMMDSFLALLTQHPNKEELNIDSILGDTLKHEGKGEYDVVVANFFLSIFEKDKMNTLLDHLLKLCKPDGQLIIGDFNSPSGSLVHKTIQQVYWYSAATTFFALTGNAIHQLYDYEHILQKKGIQIKEQQSFSVLGQSFFRAFRAQK
jgi:demethylmenaquinone methyltransferase/2-methoxy-6-polyprenyl-1,4-benzoquinol methylase